nr:hypothetical protein [Cohaesibacter marisflavi]
MSMTAAFLLMEDHDAGLAFEPLCFGYSVCGFLEHLQCDTGIIRWVQRYGEIWLFTTRALGYVFDFHESACHII